MTRQKIPDFFALFHNDDVPSKLQKSSLTYTSGCVYTLQFPIQPLPSFVLLYGYSADPQWKLGNYKSTVTLSCTVNPEQDLVLTMDQETNSICMPLLWSNDVKKYSRDYPNRLGKLTVKYQVDENTELLLEPIADVSHIKKIHDSLVKNSGSGNKSIENTITPKNSFNQENKPKRQNTGSVLKEKRPREEPQDLTRSATDDNVDNVPEGRWGHISVACGSELNDHKSFIVYGGQGANAEYVSENVFVYDVTVEEWIRIESGSITPGKRSGHSACYLNDDNTVVLFGGSLKSKWMNDVWFYNVELAEWSVVEASGSAPALAYHGAAVYGQDMWIFGGARAKKCFNEFRRFNCETKEWTTETFSGDIPLPRSGLSMVSQGSKIVLFGGWDSPDLFNDLYLVDVVLMTCKKISATGDVPSPRCWHSATFISKDLMLIYGGFDGNSTLNDAYVLDTANWSWKKIRSDFGKKSRAGHTLVTLNGDNGALSLYIFGGGNSFKRLNQLIVTLGDNDGGFFNDVEKLDINPLRLI